MTEVGPLHREHPIEYPEGTPPLGEDEAQARAQGRDRGQHRVGRPVARRGCSGIRMVGPELATVPCGQVGGSTSVVVRSRRLLRQASPLRVRGDVQPG